MPPPAPIRDPTISVTALHREEISADKADLWVTIKGTSLVTGSAALKKSKEVNQMVTALLEIGVKENELSLQDIRVDSSNGILTRTSSASYTLRVRCSNLELLGEILGAIGSQKNVTLDRLIWRYPDHKQMQMEWMERCIAEAKERAARIAAALGVKLLSIRNFSEAWKDPEEGARAEELGSVPGLSEKTMARARVDLGFSLSHSKAVEQRVDVTFAIERGEAATGKTQS